MAAPLPPVGRRTVEALLAAYAKGLKERRLVLVHGQYAENAPTEFTTKLGEQTRRVTYRGTVTTT